MILCFQNDLEVLDLFMLSSQTCFFFFLILMVLVMATSVLYEYFLSASDIYMEIVLLQYIDIYLTRVDGLRRRISSAGSMGDTFNYSLIRDVFQVCFLCKMGLLPIWMLK